MKPHLEFDRSSERIEAVAEALNSRIPMDVCQLIAEAAGCPCSYPALAVKSPAAANCLLCGLEGRRESHDTWLHE